jgi:DNA phosphorothioation-associated putative methyltransferase
MDLDTWNQLITKVETAKRMPDALYLHPDALPEPLQELIQAARVLAGSPPFTVLKLYLDSTRLSFLDYPDFDTEAFPVLKQATLVDVSRKSSSIRSYQGESAPVLHRKELLLPAGDPRYRELAALTKAAEEMGLFQTPALIGTQGGWQKVLAEAGVRVEGHQLLPQSQEVIQRHRTALVRYRLSTPMQALYQHGFLDGVHSVFDYGCGRGGDLQQLSLLNVASCGWDPHFAPDAPKKQAAIVNLGFVLNVIEHPAERLQALQGAWELAEKLLVVAVLLGGRSAWEKHRLYQDGVITSKGTFQKYFSQEELLKYLEQHTQRQPVAMGPGLFFVFRSDEEEQSFLARRQQVRRRPVLPGLPEAERPVKQGVWEKYGDQWTIWWQRCLELGRVPEDEEWCESVPLGVGRAFKQCVAQFGEGALVEAKAARMGELSVWLALGAFENRASFKTLSKGLQRDIRAFYGSWGKAVEAGRALLFSAGQAAVLERAAEAGPGWREDGGLFILGRRLFELSPVLRVVVGCAERLYGALEKVDVIKIHLRGGKVTLLQYDDFEQAIPKLVERVKVDLRRQEVLFFSHDGNPFLPQPFWKKGRLLEEGHPDRERLRRLEARLEGLNLPQHVDQAGFERILEGEGIVLRGGRMRRVLKRWLEEP